MSGVNLEEVDDDKSIQNKVDDEPLTDSDKAKIGKNVNSKTCTLQHICLLN